MENRFRFILDKGSKKFYCEGCNRKKLVRYIDIETNEYLPEKYGRCDGIDKCTYHINPYSDGYHKSIDVGNIAVYETYKKISSPKKIVYFDSDFFKKIENVSRFRDNVFLQNIMLKVPYPFEEADVFETALLYRLGTISSGNRSGAVAFPFIDLNKNIRTVQIVEFHENNHRKSIDYLHSMLEKYFKKNGFPLPNWLSSYLNNEKKVSCLFGEHLLEKFPDNPIALVEAPKTAIYGTLYFGLPKTKNDLIWLAVNSRDTFTFDKLKVLKNKNIVVFPDLSKDGSTYNMWKEKASRFALKIPGVRFHFSDLLEKEATEKERIDGLDLADFLISQNWRLFRS